ncbi:MAG: four helix bundle protein [Armatimonadota bacterium]|nr:four helix bundle protein [Armatimonadota bacterium]
MCLSTCSTTSPDSGARRATSYKRQANDSDDRGTGRESGKDSFRDLTVWQRAVDVAGDVYRLTETYPKRETYGLTSQMRRCAASIPANIAEGRGRHGDGDFLRFLYIAAGSLAELETFVELSRRLDYATNDELAPLERSVEEVGRMLQGLICTVREAVKK